MKLYWTGIRSGIEFASLREPTWTRVPSPLEPLFMANIPWWYDPAMHMTRDDQAAWVEHFLRIAYYSYGLIRLFEVRAFVSAEMAKLAAQEVYLLVGGVAVLAIVVYGILYILNPEVRRGIEQTWYGTGFLMRYQENVWWARFVAWEPGGWPVFERLAEIGPIIAYEHWNHGYPMIAGDYWFHGESWLEKPGGWPIYLSHRWTWSVNYFVGFLTHATEELYVLQRSYWSLLPF